MERNNGITYFKALLPPLVVACHARPFGPSASMMPELLGVPDWKDVFYVNLLCLAVPLFYLISFFLYLRKREQGDTPAATLLIKRVFYFAGLFLAWRLIFCLAGIGTVWNPERGLARNLYHLLFAGGDTLLYYLEQMIYDLVILECFCRIQERYHLDRKKCAGVALAASSLLVAACQMALPQVLKIEALRYFSPVGFLPYVFLACLLYPGKPGMSKTDAAAVLTGGLLCAAAEWRFLPDAAYLGSGYSMAIPYYARLSVILISWGLFALALGIRRKPGKGIEVMSGVSLYVYCIHQLIIRAVGNWVSAPLAEYVCVLFLTYAASLLIYLGKRNWKEGWSHG